MISKFGIDIIESHHSPEFFMDWAVAENLLMFYVLNGDGQIRTRRNRYPLKKGHVVVVQKNVVYRVIDTHGRPLSVFLLGIGNPDIRKICKDVNVESVRLTTHKATTHRVQKLLKDLLFEQTMRRPGMEIAMGALTLELMLTLLRCWTEEPEHASTAESRESISRARVAVYVRQLANDFYRPQNLDQAATASGLHIRRFQSLFCEVAGTSWIRYIRQKRIDYAKRLLLETSRSVMAICFECGFEDISNFFRCFKKLEKTSPDAWRLSHQRKVVRQVP